MKTFMLEIVDEACGMVRYFTVEVQAKTRQEAMKKWNEDHKDSGPGYFIGKCWEKTP